MLSQKLSTSTRKTLRKRRRFGSLSLSLGRRYQHLASQIDLIEREVESRFLQVESNDSAPMSSAKSAIQVNLFIERAEMLISISEAARDYLRVSRSTIYRLAEEGAIQIVHVRGSARIPLKSIEEYVESLCGGYR